MLYLFALVEMGELTLGEGWQGEPLQLISYNQIGAVVCSVSDDGVPVNEDNLWHHEQIVEGLMGQTAVLPVRFGTQISDEAEMISLLKQHETHYQENLNFVRGRVELSLRVLWSKSEPEAEAPSVKTAESGTAYLMGRMADARLKQAQQAEAEKLAAELQVPLRPLSVAHTEKILVTKRLLLTAAYLVPQEKIEPFKAKIDALGDAYPDLQLLCTGPWPPYNFVRPNDG